MTTETPPLTRHEKFQQLCRTLRYLHPMQLMHRVRLRALRPLHASSLYASWLGRHRPKGVVRVPADPWPGNAENGVRAADDHVLRLLHIDHPIAPPVDWVPADQTPLYRFTLHYFEWLGDLKAAGKSQTAQRLVADWLDTYGQRPDPGLAWHPYPLSLRLFAWLKYANFFLADASDDLIDDFWDSVERQARYLPAVLEKDVGGNHLIKNLKALIAAGLCLRGHEAQARRGLKMLLQQLRLQILPDGAHYERSPAYHAQVLGDLVEIEALLTQAGHPVPEALTRIMRTMTGALVYMRHPDGGLALFNDGTVGDPAWLDALTGSIGRPPTLPDAGLYRLSAGDTVVLADCGKIGPDELPAHAHADTLSFEMSVGSQRLIVNGGTYAYQDPLWRPFFRATKAHSTVEIDRHDSAEVYGAFRVGRRPERVVAAYHPRDGELIGDHDGYAYLGLTHERRWRLNADGSKLYGRDVIEKTDGDAFPHTAIARFHLHPDVAADKTADGVTLILPDDSRWTFKATGGAVDLRDSVYAPDFNVLHDTRQITVSAPVSSLRLIFEWSLVKDDPEPEE